MEKPSIDIPFVAKRATGDRPWQEFGSSEAEFQFWAPHICGIACLRSLILAARKSAPSLWALTQRAVEVGVFKIDSNRKVEGAFHVPLVLMLKEHGISASIFGRLSCEEVWALSENGVVMLSIDLAHVRGDLVGSHLVLVVGRDEDMLLVHDSARVLSESGCNCRIAMPTLNMISNGRGIVIPWKEFSQ